MGGAYEALQEERGKGNVMMWLFDGAQRLEAPTNHRRRSGFQLLVGSIQDVCVSNIYHVRRKLCSSLQKNISFAVELT